MDVITNLMHIHELDYHYQEFLINQSALTILCGAKGRFVFVKGVLTKETFYCCKQKVGDEKTLKLLFTPPQNVKGYCDHFFSVCVSNS